MDTPFPEIYLYYYDAQNLDFSTLMKHSAIRYLSKHPLILSIYNEIGYSIASSGNFVINDTWPFKLLM